MKHVVIVGAGFAGLNAAKRLSRQPDLQRIFVVTQWAWAYLAFNRGARLIVEREWRAESEPPSDRSG